MDPKKDIMGLFFKYFYNVTLLTGKFLYTPFVFIDCYLKQIQLGKGVSFYGKSYFYRRRFSTIVIGNNCGFRSLFHSNLIGINRPCSISTLRADARIRIGNNCGFSGTIIGAASSIFIGNNVRCGANTLITDNDWHLDDIRSDEPKPIVIHDNVWLGEGSKVLKGVEIGKNSVIGAGSVVTKSVPENVVAAGNPCKEIRDL